jgi:hypothetical protein
MQTTVYKLASIERAAKRHLLGVVQELRTGD